MLGFHVHFDKGYSNVENQTLKKNSTFCIFSDKCLWPKQFLLELEPRSAFFCDEKSSEVMGSILVEGGRNTQPVGPLTSAVD